jgi:hypothetical protein
MKKKAIFAAIIAILVIGFGYTYVNQENALEKRRIKHADLLKNHPYNKTLALSKEERKAKGIPPNKYFEQEYLNEINPKTGRTHPENIIDVQKQLSKTRLKKRVPGDDLNNPWIERGPNNVGGRTRVVLFDPNDNSNKRVFAGGVSGGLWVNDDITDVNSSWNRIGIPENLSVSCMAVDPNNSQIMYVGTGELYTSNHALGNGVWKSIDGGATWANVYNVRGTTSSGAVPGTYYTTDIIVRDADGINNATNDSEIFVGIGGSYHSSSGLVNVFIGTNDYGLFKSADAGANWNRIALNNSSGRPEAPNDLEISVDNKLWISTTSNVYGDAGGSIYSSSDGIAFTKKHTVASAKRTEIAVSKTNKDKIYILAELTSTNPVGLYLTTDGFLSAPATLALPNDADTGIPDNDFTRGLAFYALMLAVDPTNDAIAYVGGINLFRSTNGGAAWKQISKWSNNNFLSILNVPLVHADQHGFAFHPTNSDMAVIGNDGGVFYASSLSSSQNTASVIEARNKDYNITQFYNGAIGQDITNDLLLAGAQDNGTQFVSNADTNINATEEVYGGDGAYSFVDKDGEYMIVSYTYNNKALLKLPYTGQGITISNDSDSGSFINPQALDDNLDIIYSNATGGGRDSIAQFKNIQTDPIRNNLYNSLLAGGATAFKVSPYTQITTKLFIGTRLGKVIRVVNANSSIPAWQNITGNIGVIGSVSCIELGANENEILVTFHSFGIKSIWFTENGGTSWQNKEGDFPDIPVKAIMMNPLNNNQVIIGTELGVWTTNNFKDTNPSWVQAYNGMSNVKVTSFDLRTSDNTVLATTYGRGMFTGKFTAAVASVEDVLTAVKSFTIYPTISKGNFTVFAQNTLGKSKLSIFDLTGKEVYQSAINFEANQKHEVSVNLNTGVYIVNIIDENNKKSSNKIIIE